VGGDVCNFYVILLGPPKGALLWSCDYWFCWCFVMVNDSIVFHVRNHHEIVTGVYVFNGLCAA